MWQRIRDRFFYRAAQHARQLPFVELAASAVLLPSARFRFHVGEQGFKGRVRIGADSMLGCEFVFESERGEIAIGERTFINGGTQLISREKISIGSDVTIAWNCTIYDHNSHSLDWRDRADDIRRQAEDYHAGRSFVSSKDWGTVRSRPIVIEDKVWIGFGCTILNGVTIGEGAVIGACSVVRENVEPWTVVCGNPATVVKRLKS